MPDSPSTVPNNNDKTAESAEPCVIPPAPSKTQNITLKLILLLAGATLLFIGEAMYVFGIVTPHWSMKGTKNLPVKVLNSRKPVEEMQVNVKTFSPWKICSEYSEKDHWNIIYAFLYNNSGSSHQLEYIHKESIDELNWNPTDNDLAKAAEARALKIKKSEQLEKNEKDLSELLTLHGSCYEIYLAEKYISVRFFANPAAILGILAFILAPASLLAKDGQQKYVALASSVAGLAAFLCVFIAVMVYGLGFHSDVKTAEELTWEFLNKLEKIVENTEKEIAYLERGSIGYTNRYGVTTYTYWHDLKTKDRHLLEKIEFLIENSGVTLGQSFVISICGGVTMAVGAVMVAVAALLGSISKAATRTRIPPSEPGDVDGAPVEQET